MQESINNKIKDALNSLDGMEQASAKPFFFTRLEARMLKEKNSWEKVSSFVARPAIAFACICAVIMINAAVIFSSQKNSTVNADQSEEIATVDEYSLVSSNFFEFVNTQP
jgi:hypothetical protein